MNRTINQFLNVSPILFLFSTFGSGVTKIDVTQSYFGQDFVRHKLVTNPTLNPRVSLNLNLTDYMNSLMALQPDCHQINLLFIDTLSCSDTIQVRHYPFQMVILIITITIRQKEAPSGKSLGPVDYSPICWAGSICEKFDLFQEVKSEK